MNIKINYRNNLEIGIEDLEHEGFAPISCAIIKRMEKDKSDELLKLLTNALIYEFDQYGYKYNYISINYDSVEDLCKVKRIVEIDDFDKVIKTKTKVKKMKQLIRPVIV